MLRDKEHFEAEKVAQEPYGRWESSDGRVYLYTHRATHGDSLAHVWYDDELYNGIDTATTTSGIEHVADHGVVGRGVLLNVAGYQGGDHLAAGERFNELEIPLLRTDTVTAEQTISETTGTRLPLHRVLLRDLSVLISKMDRLGDLAAACAAVGRYEFLYVAAPLHVMGGSGGPVNPVAVK